MTELPKNRTGLLGLEARSFRRNAAPDRQADNSCWTDTPKDKASKKKGGEKKMDSREELEERVAAKRDAEMAARVKAHKRDAKSLLEHHQKKSKKGKVRLQISLII